MPIKVSDFIASFLKAQGIQTVFELSGGMITHMLDSLYETKDIKIISVHHEQSAAFAAEGYGRATGLPGIAFATSGPGAVNLLTGIGSCYFDSTPAVFITGQVNTFELKGERNIRQFGFQETDIVTMARPVTKAVFQISQPEDVEATFYKAFEIALSGRPGPVLIDIPMNIQRAAIEVSPIYLVTRQSYSPPHSEEKIDFEALFTAISQAKKPLILAGRGIRSSFTVDLFTKFAELTQIPVVASLLAVDILPYDHPLRVGFIGSYGNRWANLALGESDLLIVLGSRLDIRQTGADTAFFERDRQIIHVDCEAGEINNRVKGCVGIVADLEIFLKNTLQHFTGRIFGSTAEWLAHIRELQQQWKDTDELAYIEGINPNAFIHSLSQKSTSAVSFLADVGNHQMWTAQSLELSSSQTFFTSGGMGAMGFALPAGIGVCFAHNKQPTVVIAGDGGFQLNIQELQTIVRNNLPIKIIVMNNRSLGMIRQFQDSYFDSKYQSTYWGYDAPDFAKIGEAYNIPSKTIDRPDEVDAALDWLWESPDRPNLLQVTIDIRANAYPKIAFGKPITDMEPFVKPIEMEGT
jgi:acetolactate synthase I/II/III large subunit